MPSCLSSGSLETEPRGGFLCKWFVEGELSGAACKDLVRGQQRVRFSRSSAQPAWPQRELWGLGFRGLDSQVIGCVQSPPLAFLPESSSPEQGDAGKALWVGHSSLHYIYTHFDPFPPTVLTSYQTPSLISVQPHRFLSTLNTLGSFCTISFCTLTSLCTEQSFPICFKCLLLLLIDVSAWMSPPQAFSIYSVCSGPSSLSLGLRPVLLWS